MFGLEWFNLSPIPLRCSCPWARRVPGAAAPLAKVTGVIVSLSGCASERRGGAKHPRFGPRSGNFAGLKESRGQFHEKIGASFYNPNHQNPAISCLMCFSRLCVWREGETPQRKWSLEQRPVLSAWRHAPFRGPTKPQIAPKWGFEPIFSPPRLDLEQACMARSACRRVAALNKISHQKRTFTPHFTYKE